jgi:hypothetical protein
MELFRTKADEVRDPSDVKCPGYNNENTAWWDGSQIYGSSEKATEALRTKLPDGKLELDERGTVSFLPRDKDGNPLTGFNNNWYVHVRSEVLRCPTKKLLTDHVEGGLAWKCCTPSLRWSITLSAMP